MHGGMHDDGEIRPDAFAESFLCFLFFFFFISSHVDRYPAPILAPLAPLRPATPGPDLIHPSIPDGSGSPSECPATPVIGFLYHGPAGARENGGGGGR